MFWGGICFDARTELVALRVRSMNDYYYYLEDIVVEHVVPFAPFEILILFSCKTMRILTWLDGLLII